MADVFISYKSERRSAAGYLARTLENYGFSVWYDYSLLAGEDFGLQIDHQIREARAVVVLWCRLSVKSEWVLDEADLAKKQGSLIPVKLEAVELPPGGFRRAHTINLTAWDGAPRSHLLDGLIQQIVMKVGKKAAPCYELQLEQERQWRIAGPKSLCDYPIDKKIIQTRRKKTYFGNFFDPTGMVQSPTYNKKAFVLIFSSLASFSVAAAFTAAGIEEAQKAGPSENETLNEGNDVKRNDADLGVIISTNSAPPPRPPEPSGDWSDILSKGVGLKNEGDYEQAIAALSVVANNAPSSIARDAQYELAGIYLEDGPIDKSKGVFWLRIAANHGHNYAMYKLGMEEQKAGNIIEAERWLQNASDGGISEAKVALHDIQSMPK